MELGRYRILSQLGQGGMATVFLGEDPMLNRLVAIKVIQAHLTYNTSLIERFTVEAKTIAALRHMNIVEVFDFGIQDNQQYLVMEYIDGQNLQTLCAAMSGQPMENTVAAAILCQAAEGLTSAEKHGVVHRDIKPENLLFNSEGVLKIADFGIAHIADEQSRTQTGAVLGSPNFMSPEQIEGMRPTHQTDLFSLGGVFYFALTGKLPFTGPSIPVTMRNICDKPHQSVMEVNPSADPFLSSLVDALLQKNPLHRPEGARWLANQLRSWLNHNGVVDLVEHCHNYIQSLGLASSQTISEGSSIPGKPLRPGTRLGTGLGTLNPSGTGARSGQIPYTMPGQIPYGMQPTTGAMGPSSRSPVVWVGALVAVAVLILSGVLIWTRISGQATAPAVIAAVETQTHSPKPTDSSPQALQRPVEQPKPSALEALDEPLPPVKRPKPIAVATPKPKPTPKPVTRPRPVPEPTVTTDRPLGNQMASPPDQTAQKVPMTGTILIRSAPPFAAITINGKPQGETPMNSPLEVPVGRCHIEIVHRLTPPFDTTITITPGSKQDFKFKLDR